MSSSGWGGAFAKAKAVEEEGRLAFADVLDDPDSAFASRTSKKKKRKAGGEEGGDGEGDEDGDGDGGETTKRGCFRQPRGLSQLYKRLGDSAEGIASDDADQEVKIKEEGNGKGKDKGDGDSVDKEHSNLARQICRLWLKNHYLSLSQPCDGSCGRSHAPPSNIMLIYRDYSFKGLSKKDRERIIAKMQEDKKTA